MNSIMEWMMLCGWMTTSILSKGMWNSQCASMTSSPLLNIVAESMVILPPMFHVGCFRHCSTVMDENSDTGRRK